MIFINRAERKRKARGHQILHWTRHPSPNQLNAGSGWFNELDRVYKKDTGEYVCMMRDIYTDWGKVTHCTITSHTEPNWADKQAIKNELFGEGALAVEVFPKQSELVDDADMYHLWVLHDKNLPFSIYSEGEN